MYLYLFYFQIYIRIVLSQCDPNCEICNSLNCGKCFENFAPYQNKCVPCWEGYHSFGYNCTSCALGCSSCRSYESCTKCYNDYFMNSNGKCQKVQLTKFCITYDSIGQCNNCQDGYYPINGTCAQCNLNCKNCTINICYECDQNYQLQESNCALINSTIIINQNNSNTTNIRVNNNSGQSVDIYYVLTIIFGCFFVITLCLCLLIEYFVGIIKQIKIKWSEYKKGQTGPRECIEN